MDTVNNRNSYAALKAAFRIYDLQIGKVLGSDEKKLFRKTLNNLSKSLIRKKTDATIIEIEKDIYINSYQNIGYF